MMLTPAKITNVILSKPLIRLETESCRAITKYTKGDSVELVKKFPISRAELVQKLEKHGIDGRAVRKVLENREINTEILDKTFDNINNAFSKDGIKPDKWFAALEFTGASEAFTRENLERLRKIDFSGMRANAGPAEKLLALNSLKTPDYIEFVLKTLAPMKKEISPLDLAAFTPDMAQFLKKTAAGNAKLNLEQYMRLAQAKRNIAYPHDFFVSGNGDASKAVHDYDIINESLFGRQSEAVKSAKERLFKDTGVRVYMDNNLDAENIEYLREFINISRASGDDVPAKIYITNLLPENANGLFTRSDAFFSRPVVKLDKTVDERRLSTFAHENGHYLDYKINRGKDYAKNQNSAASSDDEKYAMEFFVSNYSLKNREEFIAEIKKLAFEGKILKYKDAQGQTVYRRYLSEPVDSESTDIMEEHFAYLLKKYEQFNGPQIRFSLLPVINKPQNADSAKNYIEVTQLDIRYARPIYF